MNQAQVFASAWALVGGRFDGGHAITDAEQAQEDLKGMVLAAMAGKDGEIARLQALLDTANATIAGQDAQATALLQGKQNRLETKDAVAEIAEIRQAITALRGKPSSARNGKTKMKAVICQKAIALVTLAALHQALETTQQSK